MQADGSPPPLVFSAQTDPAFPQYEGLTSPARRTEGDSKTPEQRSDFQKPPPKTQNPAEQHSKDKLHLTTDLAFTDPVLPKQKKKKMFSKKYQIKKAS